jgi:alkanesulfonate monooxygenase SsuD/methylene tetrahydromethanopterin reductase-like flavin-dependent oxidoreductase (luciferase family)
MEPFRFGVSVWSAGSRAEWAGKARKFEDLGFSTLLVPDHLVEAFPPLVPLVSAAEATTTLRVGTFVLNNDFRHPVLLAREAATVDLLTDGRLLLSLAAREADIIGFTGFSPRRGGQEIDPLGFKPAEVDRRLDWVRLEAGDRFDGTELDALVQRVVITDRREQAATETAAPFPELLADDIPGTRYPLLGTVEQIAEELVAHREHWGFSY